MPSQDVNFEAADVEMLYRGGKPSSWEEMLKRAEQSAGRRRVSGPEAREMAYALKLIQERGGAIPNTPRECYLQMLEVLVPMPGPGAFPA